MSTTDPHATYQNPDPFIRQAYVGRIGLLVTLSALALNGGFLWIAHALAAAILPQELQHSGSVLGFIVRFSIDTALGLTSVFLAVRCVQNRPFRSAATAGRPVHLKLFVQGALIGVCLQVPSHIVLLWTQPVTFDQWIGIVYNGFGTRMSVYFVGVMLLYPFQALCEELVFRGFLTQLLGDPIRHRIGLALIVALLFTLVHGRPGVSSFASIFAISLLFSAATHWRGGIEWAVGYHAVVDIVIAWAAYLLSALPGGQLRYMDDFLWSQAALHASMACLIYCLARLRVSRQHPRQRLLQR